MAASCPIVSHNRSATKTAGLKYLADQIQTSRPHQWQCEADGDGWSVQAIASLVIAGEPDANRSSGGRTGES